MQPLPQGGTMSCRIGRFVTGEDFAVLCVSGQPRGQNVDTLRDLLGREKGGAAIDLKDFLLVDREAAKLFAL